MSRSITCSALLIIATAWASTSMAKDHSKTGNPGHGSLPPGLHKKVNNGGELPPGWQKKLHPGYVIEADIYRHHRLVVPIDDKGLVTVEIGGKLIRLYAATREVLEVLND